MVWCHQATSHQALQVRNVLDLLYKINVKQQQQQGGISEYSARKDTYHQLTYGTPHNCL